MCCAWLMGDLAINGGVWGGGLVGGGYKCVGLMCQSAGVIQKILTKNNSCHPLLWPILPLLLLPGRNC
jgi:hypothetical protein